MSICGHTPKPNISFTIICIHIIMVVVLGCILMVQFVSSLRVLSQDQLNENSRESTLLKIIDALSKSDSLYQDRRKSNDPKKLLFESIHRDLSTLIESRPKSKHHLPLRPRAEVVDTPVPPLTQENKLRAKQNEQELEYMSRSAQSELLLKPYLEKKGRNDYLVIQTDSLDPFVTVVPNSIYYDAEKKCVNWLDACSLKGIRAHLLKKVLSPYK